MKIRQFFVSNSSSSSFIIAYKPGQENVRVNMVINLKDYISDTAVDINSSIITELIEDERIDLATVENLFKEGYKIAYGSFDSQGDPVEMMLCETGLKSTDFKGVIIESEGGY